MLLSEICGLVSVWRTLWREDGSAISSVITQWSESLRTRNHTLVSHLRLPQPRGPGSHVYIVISPKNRVAELYPRALVHIRFLRKLLYLLVWKCIQIWTITSTSARAPRTYFCGFMIARREACPLYSYGEAVSHSPSPINFAPFCLMYHYILQN
jgi:hypothetical protein